MPPRSVPGFKHPWPDESPLPSSTQADNNVTDDEPFRLQQELAAARANEASLQRQLHELSAAFAASQQQRLLLEALMQNLPDHVYFKDRESRVIRINMSQARRFGLSDPDQAIGKTDADFFTAEHADQARADEIRVMETGQPIILEEKETWSDRGDGWVLTTKAPLRNQDGEIIGTFGISHDITVRRRLIAEMEGQITELSILNANLKQAQNQLLQSEKMASVGQLAAGVAHEINNPMGFLNSNLHSLAREVDDLLRLVDFCHSIESLGEADRARIRQLKADIDLDFLRNDITNLIQESLEGVLRVTKIVRNLRDYSRVDEKEWHFFDIEKGLDSTLSIAWNSIKYKAEVVRRYAGLPEIECIGSQINQVFMNLLINAAQAIREKGTITLSTGFDEAAVWIDVADTGCGIDPQNLSRVFEPFFTTKPPGQGTGLGLSLSYGIVRSHHGDLTVESHVGQGTVFRVTLPRKQPPHAAD